MTIERDLEKIALQEERLCFDAFDAETAWELGCRLKSTAEARGVAVTIEIRLAREPVFLVAMRGVTPSNADWARRKRNLVEFLGHSSYAEGLSLKAEGSTLESKYGLPLRDYANHGGCFPIRVRGVGFVGTVTVSGLPQRDDHALVVEVLAAMCGVPLAEVALEA